MSPPEKLEIVGGLFKEHFKGRSKKLVSVQTWLKIVNPDTKEESLVEVPPGLFKTVMSQLGFQQDGTPYCEKCGAMLTTRSLGKSGYGRACRCVKGE